MAGPRRVTALVVALLAASCLVLSARQDRTAEILSLARQAIGGEARLTAISSLSMKGSCRSDFDCTNRLYTDLEVRFQAPDKFLVVREWPTWFTRQIAGFNGSTLLEQWRDNVQAKWSDTRLGDARSDGTALAMRTRELLRYLIAWTLNVPAQYQVTFRDAGQADTAQGRADVLQATGAREFAARLFFSAQTHRPLMLTYSVTPRSPWSVGNMVPLADPLFKSLEMADAQADTTMRLWEYRRDDDILFPHKIAFEVEKLSEEWNISRFKVNPRLDPELFEVRK